MKIIVLGEILWDIFEDGEHLGGAPFNFAAHARRLGHDVTFVSAVGADVRGKEALARASALGLSTRYIREVAGQPTGIVPVTIDAEGQPRFTICRPAAYDYVSLSEHDLCELSTPAAHWIYFGTLHQTSPRARETLAQLRGANPRARRFYDVNLRPQSYDAQLVRSLLAEASFVKLNEEEARLVCALLGAPADASISQFCRTNALAFGWEGVCVTRGASGCALLVGDDYAEVAGYPAVAADTVGAGDAFAAAFLHGLNQGWATAKIGDFANRVGALIASRRGAIPAWTVEEANALRA
ncbi:MAG: PfkB family carbohydrate kinase [Terriglobia bacterium]